MSGMEGAAAVGPSMGAVLSSMQGGGDPSQRLLGALPPLGGQLVQFGQGFHERQVLPAFFLAMSAQGGFHFGLFPGAKLFQGLFIDLGTFTSSFIGESGIQTPDIMGSPIEGARIEGGNIEGARIEGPQISASSGGQSILADVSQVSAPSRASASDMSSVRISSPSV